MTLFGIERPEICDGDRTNCGRAFSDKRTAGVQRLPVLGTAALSNFRPDASGRERLLPSRTLYGAMRAAVALGLDEKRVTVTVESLDRQIELPVFALCKGPQGRNAMVRILAFLGLVLAALSPSSAQEPGSCTQRTMRDVKIVVCAMTTTAQSARTLWKDRSGTPYGSLGGIDRTATPQTGRMLFAMNAGMYHENLNPVGLYVENGESLRPAVTGGGPGNFHMRPNGVFYVTARRTLGVMETRKFVSSRIKAEFASQSGPMLLIGGKLHPAFTGRGQSRKIRNGVGVSADGTRAWFVISEEPVTFTDFALIFRELKAHDALYFDGSVSSLFAPSVNRADRFMPVGPIVAVYGR